MADLAVKSDVKEQPAELDAEAGGAPDSSVSSLEGRCNVHPNQPLPNLSTPTAQAFHAVDNKDGAQQSYALITDPQVPFRWDAIIYGRDLGDVAVVKPILWSSIDWPKTSRREIMLLLRRPPGEPLMSSMDAQIAPMNAPEITRYLMKPIATLLFALADQRMAHRNIRPTNLFRAGSEGPIVAGEFYSAPSGFNQPSIFESIERAMCPPAARGIGDIGDDLYALGATALCLALGRNPAAGVDERQLLAKRAEMGSYAALTMSGKPPSDIAPVIRSLMHDDPGDRWKLDDLRRWLDSGIAVQPNPVSVARSDRGFEFEDGRYHTRRELALAFGQNWQAAREVAKTDAVERWAERSIKSRDLTDALASCRLSTGKGPRLVSDDLLLSRTILTLDPDGPLRFRDICVMPDGLGALAALTPGGTDTAAAFSELILSRLMEVWFANQEKANQASLSSKRDADKMFGILSKTGPGFGIERCAYQLNKSLVCQSPRLKGTNVIQIRDLMEVLDAGATRGEQQLDRHVAAFLGARYSGSLDAELTEFGNARNGEDALVAQLKIFAAVQFKHGPPRLPNLASLFLAHVDTLLSPFQNVALKQRLRKAAEHVAPTGKLPELLGAVRNSKYLRLDQKGFEQAQRQYRALGKRIYGREDERSRTNQRSLALGRTAAAYVSSCIAATVVLMVFLGGIR